MDNRKNIPKVLLASASPRRAFLLESAHIPFRQVRPDYAEEYPPRLRPKEIPSWLAEQKAAHSLELLEEGELLLTADSVVILDDEILEKPDGREQAREMLRSLSGRMHEVVTGVCIRDSLKKKVISGHTRVWFGDLKEDEIEYYLQNFRPYDKAGSYGIQEWIGWCKIRKIDGSYSNVMGLPVHLVYETLSDF